MAPIFEDFRENETLLKFSHLQRPESGPAVLDFEDKKTINQGQNEFQQISGRVKVIIQTLDDDTYLTYLYKGQFSKGGPRLVRILGPKGFVLSEDSC